MASKRKLRRKECGSKVRHPTQTAAVAHSRHLRKELESFTHSYKCPWCGQWHVGHGRKK